MKKTLIPVIIFLAMLCVSCGKPPAATPMPREKSDKITGVWISYIELDEMVKSGDVEGRLRLAIQNCADFGITDIFLHTVAFCDAIYNSAVYPKRNENLCRDTDVLATAVNLCHENGIKLHAWINPYRVRTADNDPAALDVNSPAYKWLNDGEAANDKNVLFTESGIYLNPAEPQVRRTVINALRELCANYKIDGVHFDDYFYPDTSESFDAESYNEYTAKTQNPLSLGDFRRAGVNALISGCYTAVKFADKNIIFSVSPAANIQKNRESYYADVAAWCKSGCVDIIIPQLYFGYEYLDERFCFDNLLCEWKALTKESGVRLCAGLAAYKTGKETAADGDEWLCRDDILSRQTKACLGDTDVFGAVYYSYSSLFSEDELNTHARQNIKNVLTKSKK